MKIAYAEYTRIAMHTGQPTVVGWPWHLEQRGQSREEVDARYRDLAELYRGSDPRLQRTILDRYRARWLVLADIERRTYDLGGDDPFALVPGVVRIAESKGAAVYFVGDAAAAPPLPAAAVDRELPPSCGRWPGCRSSSRRWSATSRSMPAAAPRSSSTAACSSSTPWVGRPPRRRRRPARPRRSRGVAA